MYRPLFSFLLITFLISESAWCQFKVSGKIISEEEDPLSGVMVIEQGTENTTIADIDGKFTILVKDSTATLTFAYVGYLTREIHINGQHEINTTLKEDAIYEKWDQKIRLYLNSGLFENPIGGQIDVLVPVFKSSLSARSFFSYQTNLDRDHHLYTGLGIYRFRINTRLGIGLDIDGYYRHITSTEAMQIESYSFESTWGQFYYISLIAGYRYLNYKQHELTDHMAYSGFVVGTDIWIPRPLSFSVNGKASFYHDFVEYQAELKKRLGRFQVFTRYYHLQSFTELSIGVGIEFTYTFKYQRNEY